MVEVNERMKNKMQSGYEDGLPDVYEAWQTVARNAAWQDELARLNACEGGRRWAAQYGTLAEAWLACERPEWMLWYLRSIGSSVDSVGHRVYTLAKCACARLVLGMYEARYPWDNRPRAAVEMAERYGRGEIEYAEMGVAASAALAAAHNAAGVSAAAAHSACFCAFDAAGRYATACASTCHHSTHAASAAADLAGESMIRQCADAIRQVVRL